MHHGAPEPPTLRGMPIQHAVLALLAEGPSYGYELKNNFEAAVGPQWGGLNIGHLYQILDRLQRDKMVIVSGTVVQERRPDRTIYEITEVGHAALTEWLGQPTARATGFRDDFILKIMAAGQRGPDSVREVCRVQRTARMGELQTLRALRRSHAEEPLALLTIEAAIAHAQADIKVIETAENSADQPLLSFTASTAAAAAAKAAKREEAELSSARRTRTGS